MTDSIAFIHLSDIHFGQEKYGFRHLNADVRQQLLADVRGVVADLPQQKVAGVLVTGDIAFSGEEAQYSQAGAWFDELTLAAGCERTAVMMVPGNHDVDLSTVELGAELMLDNIRQKGLSSLERILASENDRDTLYRRFHAYQPFASAYNCSLDLEGGMPEAQAFALPNGRTLRLVGLNSALSCDLRCKKGELLLGRRQWPIPCDPHDDVVVLIHHPLDWLQDAAGSSEYILARARVLITGHEHLPQMKIIDVEDGGQVMLLAAGATTRPESEPEVPYTYNVLQFSWPSGEDALEVSVQPRTWSPTRKRFFADPERLVGQSDTVKLRRPAASTAALPTLGRDSTAESSVPPAKDRPVPAEETTPLRPDQDVNSAEDAYPALRLRFFRELAPRERLAILVELDALPSDFAGPFTHADERRALESLRRRRSLEALAHAIETRASASTTALEESA